MNGNGIVVALAGNPNSGKTSLFNFITGLHQHVANYPGVTVERKEGTVRVDETVITFLDLPGTYSLGPFSLDEYIARNEILSPKISLVIVVVDTARLERNLYFASQVIETGKPVILALNMYDEFEESGSKLDSALLSQILGVPCVGTVGNRGRGVAELLSTVLKVLRSEIQAIGKPPHYSHETEHAIEEIQGVIERKTTYNSRWTAVNLLLYGRSYAEKGRDKGIDEEDIESITTIRQKLKKIEGKSIQTLIAAGRYGFASGAVVECLKMREHKPETSTERIDTILNHKWLGFPIFLTFLWVMFWASFRLGEIPMGLIEAFFTWLRGAVSHVLPSGFIQSLITDGIIGGVGSVLVFIPNIIILFFFISLLEDTGYMARVVFLMDRVMHFFGLHGASCLPMLVGLGCTVPAIMATRVLHSRKDRLITMFIVPFISCQARLPVYILLAGTFFGPKSAGNVIFSLYLFGIAFSLLMAKILSSTSKASTPFVMELPPYRIPTLRSILIHIWERIYLYLKKAGTLILAASVIVWFLVSYPKVPSTLTTPSGDVRTTQIKGTYAGRLGDVIEPVLKPLGFNWEIGFALTAGLAAKEVIVSTLGTIYAVSKEGDVPKEKDLKSALKRELPLDWITAYGLMLFVLLYFPCVASLGVIRREAGGLKWVVLMVVYTTGLAWLVSFLFTRIMHFLI